MRFVIGAAVAIAVSMVLPRDAAAATFFLIDVPPHPETVVLKLRDPVKVEHARRILSGEETLSVHVIGKVRKRAKRWNPGWSWHLLPRSVEFFELAIEVCDSSIGYIEEHLAEVGGDLLPGRVWCPWGSHFLAEIPRP